LIENLVEYSAIDPLKFTRTKNALQFVFDFFEH